MKKLLTLFFGLGLFFVATAQDNIYGFTVKNQNGKEVKMSDYRGQYILIVNTATHCGFTPQYEGLEQIYEKYKDDGFVILDFPCNQFGEQAPGDNKTIHNFCTKNYGITFPQFAKVDVNGKNADPLFTWLKSQKGFEGFNLDNPLGKRLHEAMQKQDRNYAKNPDIKWNFTKFLIDRDGKVVKRFEPTTDIYDVMNELYYIMYN